MKENSVLLPLALDEQVRNKLEKIFVDILEDVVDDVIDGSRSKQYFNKKEAAHYIGVSFNTLQKFIANGLPVVMIDGMQIIRKVDIDNFLEANIK